MNQNKRKFKGVLSGFMATALTASFLPLPESQAKNSSFYDVNSYDWYATSVERWSTAGIIHGTGDNLFSPDSNVTRGQIAVMINNVMGYEVESQALFSDLLDPSKYYYSPLRYLAAAGVMDGRTDGSMGSEDDVTREEAAIMLCNAFFLKMSENTSTTFADNYAISSYAVSAVVTLNEMGVLNGTPDNMVMPKGHLTRAEFATMLHALIKSMTYSGGTTANAAATHGTTIVNTGTTVENTNINGDLILAPGISYGDVYLDDLSISGNIYVKGGGVESIYVNDVDMEGEMLVGRDKDPVRVVFTGSSALNTLKVQNDSIIDATALTSEGHVSDITIESGENVEIVGTFTTLTNEAENVNLTISGNISEIIMNENATINGVDVPAGTTFDSNSIPGLDVEQPEITLVHDYGTAVDDSDNDPYALSEVMTVDFDAATGEVVATIRVEDEEDCVLMAENHNAITVYNPNDLASLNTLELTVERKDYSSYSEFEVSFTMAQNYSEVPLSVNFKDKYAAPDVNIIMNYNDLPKASAEYEVAELEYNTSSETASGVVTLSDIKYCEPHYLEKYVITYDEAMYENLEFTTSDIDYDSDESTAEISFNFNGAAVDTIDLTVNMLKTDAEDEIPTVEAVLYHYENESDLAELKLEYAELNAQGMMELKVVVDDIGDHTLLTSSKAITIMAESGEESYGYGMDFDYELTHEGSTSYYTITFAPSAAVEEVIFMINVEDLDENIPDMYTGMSLARISSDDYSDYVQINMNTRTFSRSQVTVEVSVDLEKLEEITGYEIDSSAPFTPLAYGKELSDYSITSLNDGLYTIKFTPAYDEGVENPEALPTVLRLNLEQTTGYVGLFPAVDVNTEASPYSGTPVPVENLPYSIKASTYSGADGYDYTVKFTVITSGEANLDGYFDSTDGKASPQSDYFDIGIRPFEDLDAEGVDQYEITDYVTKWISTATPTKTYPMGDTFYYEYDVTMHIDTYLRTRAEDLAINVKNVAPLSTEGDGDVVLDDFIEPIVGFSSPTDNFSDWDCITSEDDNGIYVFKTTESPLSGKEYDWGLTLETGSGFEYEFTVVKDSDTEGSYILTITLDNDARGIQTFFSVWMEEKVETYDVTISQEIVNGSVLTDSISDLSSGDYVEFTVKEDAGHKLEGLYYYQTGTSPEVSDMTEIIYYEKGGFNLNMPEYSITIYAVFVQDDNLVLDDLVNGDVTLSDDMALVEDLELEKTLEIPSDVTLDLDGQTLIVADGGSIVIDGKQNIDLTGTNSAIIVQPGASLVIGNETIIGVSDSEDDSFIVLTDAEAEITLSSTGNWVITIGGETAVEIASIAEPNPIATISGIVDLSGFDIIVNSDATLEIATSGKLTIGKLTYAGAIVNNGTLSGTVPTRTGSGTITSTVSANPSLRASGLALISDENYNNLDAATQATVEYDQANYHLNNFDYISAYSTAKIEDSLDGTEFTINLSNIDTSLLTSLQKAALIGVTYQNNATIKDELWFTVDYGYVEGASYVKAYIDDELISSYGTTGIAVSSDRVTNYDNGFFMSSAINKTWGNSEETAIFHWLDDNGNLVNVTSNTMIVKRS